jgi:Ser/Thr protein kinase RdoA (MazF antagonist)
VTGNSSVEPAAFLDEMRALALIALRDWDLAVANLAPIKVRENAVFRVDLAGGGRAVLRVHRCGYHSDDELDSEFVWMRALEAAGISVPRVICSRRGRDFEVFETPANDGARQIDVFEWIDGRQLGTVETGVSGDAAAIAGQYRMIGAIAARMHNHTSVWQRPPGFRRHSWDAAGLVGDEPFWGRFWELAALTPAQRSLLMRTRARIAVDLAAFGMNPDRYGLIHADLVPENLLIDGNRIQVIDFDDAGFGWHLFELATSLYFITGDDIYPAAREALIRGYRSERGLPDEALEWLPLFLAVRGTTYLGWVHTRQGSDTANEMTPFLVERACAVAEEYLATSRPVPTNHTQDFSGGR